MIDGARELAEQVNERAAHQRHKEDMQLHRFKMCQALGPSFWKRLKTIAHDEVETFNNCLTAPEFRITVDVNLDTIEFRREFSVGRIRYNAAGLCMEISCEVNGPIKARTTLNELLCLKLDHEDRLYLQSDDGPWHLSTVVVHVLKHVVDL